jgi:hypothetical protein
MMKWEKAGPPGAPLFEVWGGSANIHNPEGKTYSITPT